MGTYWLTNPLTNRMVEPLTILLLVMFGGAALALLVRSQQTLLDAVDGVTENQARWKPSPGNAREACSR